MTKDEAITAVKEVTGMSLPWDDRHYEALQMAIEALSVQDVPDKNVGDTISRQADIVESHNEKQILEGCISLIQEMCNYFREYLDFIDLEPEYEEEKQPFCMSYFHIVNRLFLWHTRHSGGNSTRKKCAELGIDDSSKQVLFMIWGDAEDE